MLLGAACQSALAHGRRYISAFFDGRDDGMFNQILECLIIRLNQEGLIDLNI
jgi:hypothetical protein